MKLAETENVKSVARDLKQNEDLTHHLGLLSKRRKQKYLTPDVFMVVPIMLLKFFLRNDTKVVAYCKQNEEEN